MILMKNLRKTTVTNAQNKKLVQKFEKRTCKKLMKMKKIKTMDNEKKVNKEA